MSRTYQKVPFVSARHGSGCRHQRLAAARRDGGRVKRSRRFCYPAKSPTLLTPEEASSLAAESQPSAKKAGDEKMIQSPPGVTRYIEKRLTDQSPSFPEYSV